MHQALHYLWVSLGCSTLYSSLPPIPIITRLSELALVHLLTEGPAVHLAPQHTLVNDEF